MSEHRNDLSILKSSSLTSALEKELEHLIISGELAPGERLNEFQLAARFGTSRGPLREASRSLEAKGFVKVIRNRGVFVQQLSNEEACEIYDIRGTLFGLAGRLAAETMEAADIEFLAERVAAMQTAAAGNDLDTYYPLNLEFHNFIMKCSGNKTLFAEYQRFVNKMHLFRVKSLVHGGGLSHSNDEHEQILDALRTGDGEAAYRACWGHVHSAKFRMLAALEALGRDDEGGTGEAGTAG